MHHPAITTILFTPPTTSPYRLPSLFPMAQPKLSPSTSVLNFWPKTRYSCLHNQTNNAITTTTSHLTPIHPPPSPPPAVMDIVSFMISFSIFLIHYFYL